MASWLQIDILKCSVLIGFTAFSTHHIRDATRRGFWFSLYGSTPPIPYFVYVGMICVIPHLVSLLLRYTTRYKSDVKPV